MAKGSGRRRYTPADGLKYDPETETTAIDRIGKSFESMTRRIYAHHSKSGAQPTAKSWYGSNGNRRGGRGRKNDFRSWKTNRSGVKAWDRPEENQTANMEEI